MGQSSSAPKVVLPEDGKFFGLENVSIGTAAPLERIYWPIHYFTILCVCSLCYLFSFVVANCVLLFFCPAVRVSCCGPELMDLAPPFLAVFRIITNSKIPARHFHSSALAAML